jgi:hypothetical protein
MKMLLGASLGAVGMLAIQALLIVGFLAVSEQDPFILNPNSGSLEPDGLTMVMFCGEGHTPEGRGSEVLQKMPPDGRLGGWSQGRTTGETVASGITTIATTIRTEKRAKS